MMQPMLGLLAALCLMADGGAMDSVLVSEAGLKAAYTQEVTVRGTVRRVPMSKGRGKWEGTGLLLDDGTVVYLAYGAPPKELEAFLGQFVEMSGTLSKNSGDTRAQSLLAPHLLAYRLPRPARRELHRLNGLTVTLEGEAANAKGGPVLLVEGEPVYLRPDPKWPAAKDRTRVRVKGKLSSQKLLPSPERGPNGEVSQGAEGNQWVLDDAVEVAPAQDAGR